MNPNYNFENEISEQYGIAAIDFRNIATRLLVTYISITQKEFDVIMWQACNFPVCSPLRIALLKTITELEMKERLTVIEQNQLKLAI